MATPTQQQIITELYKSHFVERYARQYMGEADRINHDDIIQELWLMICEIQPYFICGLYTSGGINAVRRYVSGMIVRQMRSDRSTIFHKYTERVYKELPTASVAPFAHIDSRADLWTATITAKAAKVRPAMAEE